MAPYVRPRRPRPPRHRLRAQRPYFYPGEVARILNLRRVDYHQLRRLFRLVMEPQDLPLRATRRWSRFTFEDLLGLKIAVGLAGGTSALKRGRRLRLAALARACESLRSRYNIQHPLREAKLERAGNMLLVNIQGIEFEPATGQIVLKQVADAVRGYMKSATIAGGAEERAAVEVHLRSATSIFLSKSHADLSRQKAGRILRARIQLVSDTPLKRRKV